MSIRVRFLHCHRVLQRPGLYEHKKSILNVVETHEIERKTCPRDLKMSVNSVKFDMIYLGDQKDILGDESF